MNRPSILDIKSAIENASFCIRDRHANKGKFLFDDRGRPKMYTGGFSVVFPYETEGKTWGFRCWHAAIDGIEERYTQINRDLEKVSLPYFCEFAFIKDAIHINGVLYPATRMRWVDGITIKDYIWRYRQDAQKLEQLAEAFLNLCRDLHHLHIAHGDLQHGNILVDNNGKLFLVDYDSLATPSTFGKPDTITGLKAYQHPKRDGRGIINEKLDYFSEVIIYTSIVAIAASPSLAERYQIDQADRMLFASEDYANFKGAQVVADLKNIGGIIPALLEIIEEYLEASSIDDLLPFDQILFKPKFEINFSREKIILGNKNKVKVTWNITNTTGVILQIDDKALGVSSKGVKEVTCTARTRFTFIAQTKSGREYKHIEELLAYNQAEVTFSADKSYTLPSVPVVLEWKTKHTKKVILLNHREVKDSGSIVVTPDKPTTYTLRVTDEFGVKEYQVKIEMLPIPKIQFVKTPLPNIAQTLRLNVHYPKLQLDLQLLVFNYLTGESVFRQFKDLPFQQLFDYDTSSHRGGLNRVWVSIKNIIHFFYKQIWQITI